MNILRILNILFRSISEAFENYFVDCKVQFTRDYTG